jgi:hypothetical protein
MLPEGFRFSQSSLQDYVDCPRRFQLRYIESQSWPGVHVEPVLEHERHMYRGARFHRLVERHQLGMDAEVLSETVADDPELLAWWDAYRGFEYLHGLKGRRYPELSLSAVVAGVPLVAKLDLVVVGSDGRVVIFDWKTYGRRPTRRWFESRLQTRVYPYVMASSGARLLGREVVSGSVSLVYWVVSESGSPVFFNYSPALFARDREYLVGLVLGVVGRVDWPLTADEDLCRFCEYRSLCGRGVGAGDVEMFRNMDTNIAGESVFLGLVGLSEVGF